MELRWKLLAAFYFPIHVAAGVFYFSGELLGGKEDCRGLCTPLENCASIDALLAYDCANYFGIGLIALAFVLPSMLLYRKEKIIQTSLFS